MSPCRLLALQGDPLSGSQLPGPFRARALVNDHGFDFTPDSSSGNRLSTFQVARLASPVAGTRSLETSAERGVLLRIETATVKSTDAPSPAT
jgi:hypothetical protein